MFTQKCPGQDMRYWTAADVHEEKCPQCGEMIEFFKTDVRLRCRSCKTRVANSHFNMGCAQWCAYAEQCLGTGARGLRKKPLRTILEEEVDRLAQDLPDEVARIKEKIDRAEEICRTKEIDILPVIAAIVIISLMKLDRLTDEVSFLENLDNDHALPREAINVTLALVKNFLNGEPLCELDRILEEIIQTCLYEARGCK